jgi:hypothetical protein
MGRWNVSTRSTRVVALVAAAIVCATMPAGAEVRVTDRGAGGLTVEAHDATVHQILDALGQSHTIRFQASEALSRQVTGTFSGPLPRVLARILDGYDNVIRTTASGIQIDFVEAAKPAKFGTSVVNSVSVTASAATPHGVSSNVDLDEENATEPQTRRGPQTVNLPSGPQPGAATIAPRVAPVASAQPAGSPRVSSNLDLDEESSR